MSATRALSVGSRFLWDNSTCTVTQILGDAVIVQDTDLRFQRIRLVDLLIPASLGGRARWAAAGEDEDAEVPDEPLSVAWAYCTPDERRAAEQRAEHVREVLTGYSTGSADVAPPGQPRPQYAPGTSLEARYRAKATELGKGKRTVQRWVQAYQRAGVLGLIDRRGASSADILGRVDPRWVYALRQVLDDRVEDARVTGNALFGIVRARLERDYGMGTVAIPAQTTRYELLRELQRGRAITTGSTKAKRSNAGRPQRDPYRTFVASHPGEYVQMDSTRLDVHAVDPLTGSWVNSELTVILDLYTRAILGLRLSAVSTKSIDVASVFYEAIVPFPFPPEWAPGASWPYHGIPENMMVDPTRIAMPQLIRGGLLRQAAGLLPETLVTDHGKAYLSEHVIGMCARLGTSLQPAREYTGSDKPQVERFFKTLRTGLLERLPGFKGEDITARGSSPEHEAVYTIAELEAIIREWVATVYHRRPQKELRDPALPGVELSPEQKYEQGMAIAGTLRLPAGRNIALEVLPTTLRTFNHYGVEISTLRYTGPIVTKYRNRSRHLGKGGRQWAFSYNPDDMSRIHFRDPDDGTWHTLTWIRQAATTVPFSKDALEYAKKLQKDDPEGRDVEEVLAELLDRIRAGMSMTPSERRIAAREAAQLAKLAQPGFPSMVDALAHTIEAEEEATGEPAVEVMEEQVDESDLFADDDLDDELLALPSIQPADFYATALEDL